MNLSEICIILPELFWIKLIRWIKWLWKPCGGDLICSFYLELFCVHHMAMNQEV